MSDTAMNAGIMMLEDDFPCIVYDRELPHPIKYVAFSKKDYSLTFVYDIPGGSNRFTQGYKLAYPLEERFAKFFIDEPMVATSLVKDGNPTEIVMHLLVFTD